MNKRYLRIHGDNIVECERTLSLLCESLDCRAVLVSDNLYMPTYELSQGTDKLIIDLLAGHNRWNVDIASELMKNGGVLREGADSYVTEVYENKEQILFAIEYCSALPAGNNAWQRNGRAYSCALAGVPYFYFAEIGGVELDEDRAIKAPRYPNPVVPFSYLLLSKRPNVFCMPVYLPHPAISQEIYSTFKNILGYDDCLKIIEGAIIKSKTIEHIIALRQKALILVELLSSGRRSVDTLRGDEWGELFKSESTAKWLINNARKLVWKKKIADKVLVSDRFAELLKTVVAYNCVTIGATDLPICIIPPEKKQSLTVKLKQLYPKIDFRFEEGKPLAIVWITGFKPRGDDSRPDRGLTPLAKMILGDSAEILSIVSGPAKAQTYNVFKTSPTKLAQDNGLWQSIINVADSVLLDTANFPEALFFRPIKRLAAKMNNGVIFPYAKPNVEFGEHDVDSAIHQLFCRKEFMFIYECLCNPPGGDWSGISHFNQNGNIFRWTSLPRVSKTGGKRPDHVIQIIGDEKDILLSIESKKRGRDLDPNIGINLRTYINDLLKTVPTAAKSNTADWRLSTEENIFLRPYKIISVGAFVYSNAQELSKEKQRGQLDVVMAFEFGKETTIHILSDKDSFFIIEILKQIQSHVSGFKIQIH